MKSKGLDRYLLRTPERQKSNGKSSAYWICNSNDVINLKLIQTEDELFTEDSYFHPNFTNQALDYVNLDI